ncbi:LysR family transcriptional regulator, cyn operon transcriptional activator [Dyadobacter koreensis]|uniref:LysR family transcriptional regulator, cyn operon transcriptional activator n=1 Tax=Dyadobacter koreensis TaxID=408657 RepID=A0A1H6YZW3_9BACT|nr:LysR substrate-binding domain-containing protein [Dyadobacter koreensis]SEJ45344.1 LysR family transcriptional regulator, cyn operon transcriptional activator [Dyadobacter koreensis]
MELRQLKYFIKAAERSNFTEAAALLNISQSTLSQQIKQLEDELGVPLFDRIGKRVMLTEAGKLFLPHAIQTVRKSEDGREMIKELNNIRTGSLKIGATYGLSSLLTQTLIRFSEKYPKIKISIEFGTSDELLKLITESKLDFALSFIPVRHTKTYVTYPLFKSILSLIVHRDHPSATHQNTSVAQLADMPLVLPVKGYSIRAFLDKAFSEVNIIPDIAMEINDIDMLLKLVDTGKWCTVLMKTSLFNYPSLVAVPILGEEMERQATITWPVDVYRKKSAIEFAELLGKEN